MKKLTVKIDGLGNTTFEGHGFEGGSCIEASRPLEEHLTGVNTEGRELKAEYYEEGKDKGTETGMGW